MKKLILICLSAFLLTGCSNSVKLSNGDFDILTLFSSQSSSTNRLWVGTFQLVFNDVKNNIIKHDITFENEEPSQDLIGLNRGEFSSAMLDKNSYYTSYGNTSPREKIKIKKGLKEKFNTTSDILDRLDWSEAAGRFYAYSMIKTDFEFLKEFDNLGEFPFNDSQKRYEFFGIDDKSDKKLYKNLNVLFYNNKNDYAVELLTKTGDIVYLYRTESKEPFDKIYTKMKEDEKNYTGNKSFRSIDSLMIPNLNFKNERRYEELCNKKIKNSDLYLSEAIETIEMELNSKGGHVKSEAAIMLDKMAMEDEAVHRHFDFDKTFALFLVDKGKNNPYLAMQVSDLSKFMK